MISVGVLYQRDGSFRLAGPDQDLDLESKLESLAGSSLQFKISLSRVTKTFDPPEGCVWDTLRIPDNKCCYWGMGVSIGACPGGHAPDFPTPVNWEEWSRSGEFSVQGGTVFRFYVGEFVIPLIDYVGHNVSIEICRSAQDLHSRATHLRDLVARLKGTLK